MIFTYSNTTFYQAIYLVAKVTLRLFGALGIRAEEMISPKKKMWTPILSFLTFCWQPETQVRCPRL